MRDKHNARPKTSEEKKQVRVAALVGAGVVLATALLIFAVRPRTPSAAPLPSTSSFPTTSTAARGGTGETGASGITGPTALQTTTSTTLAP